MKSTRVFNLLLGLGLLLSVAPIARTTETFSSGASLAANNWEVACVDCPPWFQYLTDHSLQLDGEGRPHIAYGGDHLYYAWHDGADWQVEVVPLGVSGVGAYAALALDGLGRPHISCHDEANGELKYASLAPTARAGGHDGLDWQIETVDEVGNWYGHGHASLAVDGANRPHVSYYDYDEGVLKYAWRDESGWQIDETFRPEGAGEYSSLALDGLDRPHIVYWLDADDDLKYAWHDGSSWQFEFEAVDGDVNLLGYPSLEVDASNRPRVAYVDGYLDYDLRYARLDAGGWQVHTVDDAGGWYPSLALDEADHPHISYYVAGELRYAWHSGTTWQLASLSMGGVASVGWGTAIAWDSDADLPHIIYRDQDGDLRRTWRDGVAWQSETIVRSREAGRGISLALDGTGRPHISYDGDGLRYAWLEGTAWQVGMIVDGDAHVGGWTSLALDGSGRAHISYHDWGDGNLKYARFNGTTRQVMTVDRAGYVGEYSSLALDSLEQPHISYFDRDNASLKYARLGGTVWLIETVPVGDAAHVGMYSSLALDGSDWPHISCEANGDLKYVFLAPPAGSGGRDGATWQVETVDQEGVVGRYSALALDGLGRPHISYYDVTNGRLKYAWRDLAGEWYVETVPTGTVGRVGRYTSLALDELDRPHVSFYDETNGDSKYAWHDGSTWQVETVSTGGAGDVGLYSALALDGEGGAHVSYYDASSRDLRYAWQMSAQIGGYDWLVYLPVVLGSD